MREVQLEMDKRRRERSRKVDEDLTRYQQDMKYQKRSDDLKQTIKDMMISKDHVEQPMTETSLLPTLTNLSVSHHQTDHSSTKTTSENRSKAEKNDMGHDVRDINIDSALKELSGSRREDEESLDYSKQIEASRRCNIFTGKGTPFTKDTHDQYDDRQQMLDSSKKLQAKYSLVKADERTTATQRLSDMKQAQRTEQFSNHVITRLAQLDQQNQAGPSKERSREMLSAKKDNINDRRSKGKQQEDDERHPKKRNAAGGDPSDDGDDEDESDSHHSRRSNRSR